MDETSTCWWKGHRAGQIAAAFYRIKQDVPRDSKDKADLSNIIRVLFKMESLLKDLSDLIRIYPGRVYLVSGFLSVLMPSLEKTMKDIWDHLGHRQPNLEKKWKLIAHNMMSLEMVGSRGSVGPSLHTRFINYERFLLQLQRLLSKPKLLEPSCLRSSLRDLLKLREYQNLDWRYEIPYVPDPSEVKVRQVTDYHWAQRIFDNRVKKTDLMTKLDMDSPSVCYDTSSLSSALEVPPSSTILLKLKFDKNALSIVIYLPFNRPNCPRMLCRWTDDDGHPRHTSRGVWELRMLRRGGKLRLESYNDVKKRPELWCVLGFKYWEKMVLFHDTFVVLKATCERTEWCDPNELVLGEETKLFKGRILDDGYEHSLSLYQDKECGAIRLSATITQGDRKLCPAWTAFIPPKDIKKPFAKRITDYHAVLRTLDMSVYAEANQYSPKKNFTTSGALRLEFTHPSEAEDFMIAWRVLVETQEAE